MLLGIVAAAVNATRTGGRPEGTFSADPAETPPQGFFDMAGSKHPTEPGGPGAAEEPAGGFSHLERAPGTSALHSRMVDVGSKAHTRRTAVARARLRFPTAVLDEVLAGAGPKGPIEEVARVAGILAAKRTGDLIPMCHPLALDVVEISFQRVAQARGAGAGGTSELEIRCTAACSGPTGVEMEALTGASVAALTVYDMTKSRDKGISIRGIELLEKTGGKSGTWRREAAENE